MNARSLLVLISCIPALALSQQAHAQQTQAAREEPEEIVVTGERSTMQLRIQLQESEKRAYEIFNEFNDEDRFDISCSAEERIGSRFKEQVCQPAFETQATRAHAQDYYDTLPGPGRPPQGRVTLQHGGPMEIEIQRHQAAFREKMKQIATEHPEFLEAIARYADLQLQYRQRIGQTAE